MNLNKIKAIVAFCLILLAPIVIGLNIVLIQKAYANFKITMNNYEPTTFYFDTVECAGDQSDLSYCYVEGKINKKAKVLDINRNLDIQTIKYFYVFNCEKSNILLHRKKNELVLNKSQYKINAILCLIALFLINPLLWFSWKYLTKK